MTKKTQNPKIAFKGYKINRGKLKNEEEKYKIELKESHCVWRKRAIHINNIRRKAFK
jgi:hypothetical protein